MVAARHYRGRENTYGMGAGYRGHQMSYGWPKTMWYKILKLWNNSYHLVEIVPSYVRSFEMQIEQVVYFAEVAAAYQDGAG